MKMLLPQEIDAVFTVFMAQNPCPKTELRAPNPFTLLISVILSAQATDKSVNKATEQLYKTADTPEKMAALGESGLIPYIKSIGLYRTKAKHIIGTCEMLISNFGSRIPATRDDLLRLPGVGRKTANVILNAVYHQPVMPVDTHVLRVARRLGLSASTDPDSVERDLTAVIPQRYMLHAHHWLVLHGRYVCTARSPQCSVCSVCSFCARNDVSDSAAAFP